MRRSTTRWLFLLATSIVAMAGERAAGAAAINFTTSGNIGNPSGTSIGNFTYNPSSGVLLPPGTFSLGSFSAQPLPDGAGLTYTHLPFFINVTLQPQGLPASSASQLNIQGEFNGTITGTSSSSVVATVTSVQ